MKKTSIKILFLLFTFIIIFSLSACDNTSGSGGGGEQPPISQTCEHLELGNIQYDENKHWKECLECKSIVFSEDHSFSDIPIYEEVDGVIMAKYLCSNCPYSNFEAHQHEFSDWGIVKNASDEEDGLEERVCHICETKEERIIPKIVYTYSSWEILVEPGEGMGGLVYKYAIENNAKEYQVTLPVLSDSRYKVDVVSGFACNDDYTLKYTFSFIDPQNDEEIMVSFNVTGKKQEHEYDEDCLCKICGKENYNTGLIFTLQNNNTYSVLIHSVSVDTLVIPSKYKGLPVTVINSQKKIVEDNKTIYEDSGEATNLYLPNTIKKIEEDAFKYFNLKYAKNNVSIYYKGSVNDWINIEFANQYSKPNVNIYFYEYNNNEYSLVKNLEIDNAYRIQDYMFSKFCIESVKIGEGVKEVGSYAFSECDKLIKANLASSIISLGEGAFNKCKVLEECNIPNGINTIENKTFFECFKLKNIDLSNVMKIEEKAFYDCDSIEDIKIHKNIEYIGYKAFWSLKLKTLEIDKDFNGIIDLDAFSITSAENLSIPHKDIKISLENDDTRKLNFLLDYNKDKTINLVITSGVELENGCFYAWTALKEVKLASSFKVLGEQSFANCVCLENIILNTGLEIIGKSSFWNCDALKSIVIPDTVTTLGIAIFGDCDNLESLTLPHINVTDRNNIRTQLIYLYENIDHSEAENHWLTNYNESKILSLKELYITKTEKVEDYALEYANNLEKITFGEVKYIGESICFNIQSLKEVDFGETVEEIGKSSFQATGLEKLYIPSSVKIIGETAFSASKIKEIEIAESEHDIDIKMSAFCYCVELDKVILPSNIHTISNSLFRGCTSLENINLNYIRVIEENGFAECTKLKNVSLFNELTEIGNCAFSDTNINVLTIPGSVNILGTYILQRTPIKELTFEEGITTIGDYAFADCKELEKVIFPNTLEEVGNSAFTYAALKNVDFPESLHTIKDYAFLGCQIEGEIDLTMVKNFGQSIIAFNPVTNIILPQDITYIPSEIANGTKITTFNFPENVNKIEGGAFTNCIFEEFTVPEGVVEIGVSAFANCTNLKKINLPSTLEVINDTAFNNCPKMKEIDLPQNLKTIGEYAFRFCVSMYSITIPASVTEIGQYVFEWCEKLSQVINLSECAIDNTFAPNLLHCVDSIDESKILRDSNGFTFCVDEDGQYYLIDYSGEEQDLILPEYFNAKPYKIRAHAFTYEDIKSIIIPDTVIGIENGAFKYCKNLEEVVIGEGVNELPAEAFYECNSLENITLSRSLKLIGDSAFFRCYQLMTITIPESVESVAYSAFFSCDKLYEIVNLSESYVSCDATLSYVNSKDFGSSYFVEGDYLCLKNPSNEHYIIKYNGNEVTLKLPDSINGNIYQLSKYAFEDNQSIKEIILPYISSLYYPVEAYLNCENLQFIYAHDTQYYDLNMYLNSSDIILLKYIDMNNYYPSEEDMYYWQYDGDGVTPIIVVHKDMEIEETMFTKKILRWEILEEGYIPIIK